MTLSRTVVTGSPSFVTGNSTTLKAAIVFNGTFPYTMTIDRIKFYSTSSSAGTSPLYRFSLQSLTDGYPSGTILSSGNAYINSQITASSLNTVTLNSSYSATIGDSFAVVFDWPNAGGTTPNGSNYRSAGLALQPEGLALPGIYYMSGSSGFTGVSQNRAQCIPLLCCSDGSTDAGILLTSSAATSYTAKTKQAVEWICPPGLDGYILKGVSPLQSGASWAYNTINYDTDTARAVIWDNSYSILSVSDDYDVYYRLQADIMIPLLTPITLSAGTTYLLGTEIVSAAGAIYIYPPQGYSIQSLTYLDDFYDSDNNNISKYVHTYSGSWSSNNLLNNSFYGPGTIIWVEEPTAVSVSMRGGFSN